MATLYSNLKGGSITDAPLSNVATTINSAAFADLPAVTGSDTMWITLDPAGANGAPEIVSVTAHTAAATSVTVVRAQQSTTARSHPVSSVWAHSLTTTDVGEFLKTVVTADITDANVSAVKLAADAVTTAKVLDANITEAKLAAAVATKLNGAWGIVARAQITADVGGFGVGTADIAGLSLTFTAVAGRVYKVTTSATLDSNHGAVQMAALAIDIGGAGVKFTALKLEANPSDGNRLSFECAWHGGITPGSITVKTRATFSGGAGNTVAAEAGNAAQILVEDIGLA